MESPKRFYLICERREDGGLCITSPEVPGLVLLGADPHAVMCDVIPAIDVLTRFNGNISEQRLRAYVDHVNAERASALAPTDR